MIGNDTPSEVYEVSPEKQYLKTDWNKNLNQDKINGDLFLEQEAWGNNFTFASLS